MIEYDIREVKKKSIVDYLEKCGLEVEHRGRYSMCRSPFSRDSNPSFIIYDTNTFYDWSTGIFGDIIDLVQRIENLEFNKACEFLMTGKVSEIENKYRSIKRERYVFKLHRHLNTNQSEIYSINKYAHGRGIVDGYYPGRFLEKWNDKWVSHPAVMFVHTDYDGYICGAKFRTITNSREKRFTARGEMQYYVLENVIDNTPEVFLAESETSANSLWMILRMMQISSVVICFGSVAAPPDRLPRKYEHIENRKLIIDYDGDEDLYNYRVRMFSHLSATPVKIEQPKGEDINSLYSSGKFTTIIDKL